MIRRHAVTMTTFSITNLSHTTSSHHHHSYIAGKAKVKVNVKVKVRTLDIVPLRETSPQKRSGMAHVFKDLTVLLAHPHIHLQLE